MASPEPPAAAREAPVSGDTSFPDGGDGLPAAPALDQPFDGDGLFALRAAVAAHGSALGLAPGRVGELVLIANELASNAVRHGGGRGRLRLWRADGTVRCEVVDTGTGLPDAQQAGQRKVAVGALDGRGLWIVRQLADDISVVSGAAGTRVTVALRLDAPGLDLPAGEA